MVHTAIFNAMERREAYALAGPHTLVRFFGGWGFEDADAVPSQPAATGYQKGAVQQVCSLLSLTKAFRVPCRSLTESEGPTYELPIMEKDACGDETALALTGDERKSQRLHLEHFHRAAFLLHAEGYVVLRGAIPIDLVHTAAEQFSLILADCMASKVNESWYQVARKTRAVFWERNHRWRIFPILHPPFNDRWFLCNPFAMALLEFFLGADFYCKFVSSDTCLQGAVAQTPHCEMGACEQWGPHAFVLNIPLDGCRLDNGPLEIWPGGSHLWQNETLEKLQLDFDVQDGDNQEVERCASYLPSKRVVLESGDLLLRNPGLLHRGTVNHTDSPRSMLTIAFFKAGIAHSYGELAYSLTEQLYEQLDPEVRPYFKSFREQSAAAR